MADISEILKFFKKEIGTRKVVEDSDIENDLGCYSADFHKLTEKYSKYFKVDMTTYLWSFHTGEEGFGSIGRLFFKPPNSRVQRLPITPKMLFEFAAEGKWNILNTKFPRRVTII